MLKLIQLDIRRLVSTWTSGQRIEANAIEVVPAAALSQRTDAMASALNDADATLAPPAHTFLKQLGDLAYLRAGIMR